MGGQGRINDQVATTGKNATRIRRVARNAFDFKKLRPGQQEAIQAVLDGRDTLAVLPTGAGKSAIYQIAASLLDGPTIVVSPLIALQRDQVDALGDHDVGDAAQINSALSPAQREDAMLDLEDGTIEFLFLAPEQFANQETLDRLQRVEPSLFVVDEAHCISEWGHDFRPDYLRLGGIVEALGHPITLALTATAAPPVRQEIIDRLRMREPAVVVQGFDRPNLWLGVERFENEADKLAALTERVAASATPGIVYAATRKRAENVAAALTAAGVDAAPYHAGMSAAERSRTQDAFMADELEVIVATTAFGMGIDKPNVRFVFHHDISDAVDSYYQEIGRAGRDGEPAQAILFFRPEDLNLRRFFASAGQLDIDQVERVAEAVRDGDGPVDVRYLRAETDLTASKVTTALSRLEDVGAVELLPSGDVVANENAPTDLEDAIAAATRAQDHLRKFAHSRVEMMRSYADLRDCRREYLLNYFGEAFASPCGNCDVCDAGLDVADDVSQHPYPLNSKVEHTVWGEGLVMRYEGDKVVVLFETVGYRTLALDLVQEEGLLESAD